MNAALARIERAAARVASAPPASADSDLQARHERLRSAVTRSIEQLDALLAGSQP